jgi:hypothetical protein
MHELQKRVLQSLSVLLAVGDGFQCLQEISAVYETVRFTLALR